MLFEDPTTENYNAAISAFKTTVENYRKTYFKTHFTSFIKTFNEKTNKSRFTLTPIDDPMGAIKKLNRFIPSENIQDYRKKDRSITICAGTQQDFSQLKFNK